RRPGGVQREVQSPVLAEDGGVNVLYRHARRRRRGDVAHGRLGERPLLDLVDVEAHYRRVSRRQPVQFAVRSQRQDVGRRVPALALDLDRQVVNVAGRRVVAGQAAAAGDGVDTALRVPGHVAAGGADVAAVVYVAGLQVVDQEMVLRLAAVVELAAPLVQ